MLLRRQYTDNKLVFPKQPSPDQRAMEAIVMTSHISVFTTTHNMNQYDFQQFYSHWFVIRN